MLIQIYGTLLEKDEDTWYFFYEWASFYLTDAAAIWDNFRAEGLPASYLSSFMQTSQQLSALVMKLYQEIILFYRRFTGTLIFGLLGFFPEQEM